jgi:hypothetical protein
MHSVLSLEIEVDTDTVKTFLSGTVLPLCRQTTSARSLRGASLSSFDTRLRRRSLISLHAQQISCPEPEFDTDVYSFSRRTLVRLQLSGLVAYATVLRVCIFVRLLKLSVPEAQSQFVDCNLQSYFINLKVRAMQETAVNSGELIRIAKLISHLLTTVCRFCPSFTCLAMYSAE